MARGKRGRERERDGGLTVLLAVRDVVRPVTGVDDVVVQEGEGTLLDRRSAVPTLPVPGAGGRVREDAVLPLAVLAADRLLTHGLLSIRTADSVRVVTVATQSALRSRERESVGTCLQHRFPSRRVTLVVVVAVLLVRKESAVLGVAVAATQVLHRGRRSLLTSSCTRECASRGDAISSVRLREFECACQCRCERREEGKGHASTVAREFEGSCVRSQAQEAGHQEIVK